MTLQCECIVDFELITIIRCSLIFPDSCFCKFQLCTPRLLCSSRTLVLFPISSLYFPSLVLFSFTFSCFAFSATVSLHFNLKNQPERRSQTQPLWSRRRSLLCFQLTGSGGFCKKTADILTDAEPLSSAFLLQLNLELDMDSHPEPLQLQRDRLDCEGSLLLNTEVDENLSFPFISDMDVQEEN